MNSLKRIGYMSLLLAAAIGLAACSSRTLVESNLGIKGAPD